MNDEYGTIIDIMNEVFRSIRLYYIGEYQLEENINNYLVKATFTATNPFTQTKEVWTIRGGRGVEIIVEVSSATSTPFRMRSTLLVDDTESERNAKIIKIENYIQKWRAGDLPASKGSGLGSNSGCCVILIAIITSLLLTAFVLI